MKPETAHSYFYVIYKEDEGFLTVLRNTSDNIEQAQRFSTITSAESTVARLVPFGFRIYGVKADYEMREAG